MITALFISKVYRKWSLREKMCCIIFNVPLTRSYSTILPNGDFQSKPIVKTINFYNIRDKVFL